MSNNTTYTYHSATDPIKVTFLNDYMFHIVFQDTYILHGFLCALLRLSPEQIHSITVTNPIEPGRTIDSKIFFLDIQVVLNDHYTINLELQVVNQGNWPERSLSYLCRTFDNLYRGENYKNASTAIHISILDFTLFPECPEFYAVNKLINVKNRHVYSDKLQLNVLELNQIELATDQDKAYGLDHWAALFKATTWEEIKMLAAENPHMDAAAQKLYESCEDLLVLENCLAREEYIRTYERLDDLTAEKTALQDEVAALQSEKITLQDENATLQDENATLQDENAKLRERLAQYESQSS